MLRLTFRSLAARKFRLLATSLAVMLGVAFMAGTLVLTDTIQKTFDDLFSTVYDDTDAVVRAEGAFDSEGVEQRGRVDASLLDTVSDVDGVDVAEPDIRGYAQLVDKDGDTDLAQLVFTFSGDNSVPTASNDTANLTDVAGDDSLSGSNADAFVSPPAATGSMAFSFGGDGPHATTPFAAVTSLTVSGS